MRRRRCVLHNWVKLLNHPLYFVIAAYPIALYSLTFASYVFFALIVQNDYFFIKMSVFANSAGVVTGVIAAIPGLMYLFSTPRYSPSWRPGLLYMGLTIAADLLFLINLLIHLDDWNFTRHPHTLIGAILSLTGVALTLAAALYGWSLVGEDRAGTRTAGAAAPAARSRTRLES